MINKEQGCQTDRLYESESQLDKERRAAKWLVVGNTELDEELLGALAFCDILARILSTSNNTIADCWSGPRLSVFARRYLGDGCSPIASKSQACCPL